MLFLELRSWHLPEIRSVWTILSEIGCDFWGCHVHAQGLDSLTLLGPFPLRMFYVPADIAAEVQAQGSQGVPGSSLLEQRLQSLSGAKGPWGSLEGKKPSGKL